MCSMVNVSESLLNVVSGNQAKVADKPEPKGGSRMFPCKLGTHGQTGLPADRRHLTYTVDYVKRGKPALSPYTRKADRKESR